MPPSIEVAQTGSVNAMLLLRLLLYFALLITSMYTDLTKGKVYNSLTLPMIPLALFVRYMDPANGGMAAVREGVVAAAVFFAIFFLIWVIGALSAKPLMGGGDVKLMAAVGALMGLKFGGWVLAYSILFGAAMSLWVLFKHGEIWAGIVGSFRRLVWPSHPAEVSDVEKRATGRTISYSTAICLGGFWVFLMYWSLIVPTQ